MDEREPLRGFRDRFHLPVRTDGRPVIYFCGNSLGLQPQSVRTAIEQELEDWARLAVDAHFEGRRPWYSYHEIFRESAARLVGARPGEVVLMNSLTVNLHLMMVSFYRPTPQRYKILTDSPPFPSDHYAIKTQMAYHGFDPNEALLIAQPRPGEHWIRTEDIEALLAAEGDRTALVFLSGVNYFTGQWFDMARITRAARENGCVVGWDLAHAAGNVPLALHDWGADFAVWCNYKYVNGGPGAVGGCFVHERHANRPDLPRFAGWWGNDPATRFRMHLQPDFIPQPGAEGWQVSNPPILAMAPVKASMDIFDEVGMSALREKSLHLTGYLEYLIDRLGARRFEIITPRDANSRGCQLSLLVHERPRALRDALQAEGVVCDFREPNVVRVAPVPLYNSFHEVWTFAQVLSRHVGLSNGG
jgi:kynureninase